MACLLGAIPNAFADAADNRLEHLHHAAISVAHAMSTAQLLGHALAKRAIGRSENQFQRDLNSCESVGAINFGEARWRLQAVDAGAKLEELANAERLFGILLEASRQWNGTAEDAFNVIDAIGVLSYQLERLSVGIGRMSDAELTALRQRAPDAGPQPRTAASAASAQDPRANVPSRSGASFVKADDQNL
jgi:hypothetical protein